jgi:isoleucyl-tRNA synthetase
LADEGLARELVRRIQDMRREAEFELSDRITTWIAGDGDIGRVLASHGDYIRGETLTTELLQEPPPTGVATLEPDLEGTKVVLGVRKN